jgi:hypothetical protein
LNKLLTGENIMNRTTRIALVAVFLGVSVIASGAVGHAGVTESPQIEKYLSVIGDAYMASMQAEIVTLGQLASTPQTAPQQTEVVPYYFPANMCSMPPLIPASPLAHFRRR